ncbi:hypothetical protein DB346_13030, partial [Verrucomicrobia bacterium LW23]
MHTTCPAVAAAPSAGTPLTAMETVPAGAALPPGALRVFAVATVLAAAAPLLTFTTALAAFGLPHVWAELAYVEGRFGSRVASRMVVGWSAFLGGILVVRVLAWMQLVPWNIGGPLELLLVGAMFQNFRAHLSAAPLKQFEGQKFVLLTIPKQLHTINPLRSSSVWI